MIESCATCRFAFTPAGNTASVECRRHAPPFVPAGQQMTAPSLPPTYWCGEWDSKRAARVKR